MSLKSGRVSFFIIGFSSREPIEDEAHLAVLLPLLCPAADVRKAEASTEDLTADANRMLENIKATENHKCMNRGLALEG
jgi:hypothetical protein